MSASSPKYLDPKPLFRVSDITTSDVTQYTAPNEAGVRVTSVGVVNKTASAVTLKFWRETTGGAICYITFAVSIPATGLPVIIDVGGMVLLPLEELHTLAGTATALDMWCDGIEMAD